jgi:chromosome segregation ATPase
LLEETERLSVLVASLRDQQADSEAVWRKRLDDALAATRERDARIASLEATERRLLSELSAATTTANYRSASAAGGGGDGSRSASVGQRSHNLHEKEVAHFRGMIDTAEGRVRALEDDAVQREEIIRMQEDEVRRLERQSEALSAAAAEAERRAHSEVAAMRSQLDAADSGRSEATTRAREAELMLETAHASLSALAASVASPKRSDRSGSAVFDDDREEANDDEGAPLIARLIGDLETVRRRATKLQSDNVGQRHQLATTKAQAEGLAARVVAVERELRGAQEIIRGRETDIAGLETSIEEQSRSWHAKEAEAARLRVSVEHERTQLAARLEHLSEEARLKALRVSTLESEYAAATAEVSRVKDAAAASLKEFQANNDALNRRIAALTTQLEHARGETAEAREHAAAAAQERDELLHDLDTTKERCFAMEKESSSARHDVASDLTVLRRKMAELQHAMKDAAAERDAAVEAAAAARKQRDVAVERGTALKNALRSETEAASAAGRAQVKQLAALLERRETEASQLRERVAILEAANMATSVVVQRQQSMLERGSSR